MASTRRGVGPRAVLGALALAVATVVALAGCASGAGSAAGGRSGDTHLTSARPTATARHTFHAYDSSGRLTVAVARHAQGTCWSTSIAAPSASTYRCFAGNQILDPCFARTADSHVLACIDDPWSKATLLTLTKPRPKATAAHRIWAFRRSDGARCVAATGTVPAVRGHNLDYYCSDKTFAALTGSHTARVVGAIFARAGASALRHGTVAALWAA